MGIERLGFHELRASLETGCDYLELNKDILDNLNVYPVPDGDTGVNMVSTLKPAVEELARAGGTTLGEISRVMCAALVRSGRGNSGFILAQFFRGFWDVAGRGDTVGPDTLAGGFERGSYAAVCSLLSPRQGTMITVIAAMAEAMRRVDGPDVIRRFEEAIEAGSRSLYTTPDLLPILAQAGVVDAGALGFLFIARGMLCGLLGTEIQRESEASYRLPPVSRAGGLGPAPGSRYCVELEVETDPSVGDGLRQLLLALGDSIALMADGGRVRVHIHTNQPRVLLERVGVYGAVTRSKMDDMEEQVAGSRGMAAAAASGAGLPGIGEGVSVLSIIPGPGFQAIFGELGASDCLVYGSSLPSAEDVLAAVNRMPGEEVIVLPNDPNIIPAARLACEQTRKRVHVLLTGSVIDGMTAMYGYSESDPAEVNIRTMKSGIGLARAIRVCRSARDTVFGEFRIREGDYFAVQGDVMLSADGSLEDTVVSALTRLGVSGGTHVSLYHGDGFDVSGLAAIKAGILELSPDLELEEHYGGQRTSLLIVSME